MRFFRAVIIIIVVLVLNYTSGWTYETGTETTVPIEDTVIVPASDRYAYMSALKWAFLGRNYRREWSVPVAMPVFHISTTKGGFTIEKLGGGQQTTSLHLINNDGSEWVLRSVDKNVELAISPKIRNTFIQDIVQDQISAAHPYGLLTIHTLARSAGIPAPTAELYYVPDDPNLDTFRHRFAHKVCMLLPKAIDGASGDMEDTDEIQEELLDSSNRYRVLQEEVLTARLLDMLLADWDRHQGQLEWAMKDSAGLTWLYPVPEDRDQAYFRASGVIPFVISKLALPHMVGFKEKPKNLAKLSKKSHQFDRNYMSRLDRQDWIRLIREFQNRLTDSVIHAAVSQMPREAYLISGADIEEKLRERRNGLLEHGLEYYRFLSDEVLLRSSLEPEKFSITTSGDSTTVTVTDLNSGDELYRRVVLPKETSKIKILNLDHNDQVDRSAHRGRIKLELVPRPAPEADESTAGK